MVLEDPNLLEKFMPSLVSSYNDESMKCDDEPKAVDQIPSSPPSGTRQPAGHGS